MLAPQVLLLKNFVLRSVSELSECKHLVDILLTLSHITPAPGSSGAGGAVYSRESQCAELWTAVAQLTGLKSLNVNAWCVED
jgi:hypothetical protein